MWHPHCLRCKQPPNRSYNTTSVMGPYKYTLIILMHRGQRATQLLRLIRDGVDGRVAKKRQAVRDDFLEGPDAVARDGRRDAHLSVYLIPSQFNHNTATSVRQSLRVRNRRPSNTAHPPYKVTMRDNIATSCNGPDHVFRHARCKHMIVAEKLFRTPFRRSVRRLRPVTRSQ